MKPSIKKRWLEALTSGDYKQGRNYLKAKDKNGVDRYCCLGVLCDLYIQDHVTKHWDLDYLETESEKSARKTVFSTSGNAAMLPNAVKQWAGLSETSPFIFVGMEDVCPYLNSSKLKNYYDSQLPSLKREIELTELNDRFRVQFKTIAKLIDKFL